MPQESYSLASGIIAERLLRHNLLDDGSLQVCADTIRQLPNIKIFDYGRSKEHSLVCEKPGPLPRQWNLIQADGAGGRDTFDELVFDNSTSLQGCPLPAFTQCTSLQVAAKSRSPCI